jgi:hypothetical protein
MSTYDTVFDIPWVATGHEDGAMLFLWPVAPVVDGPGVIGVFQDLGFINQRRQDQFLHSLICTNASWSAKDAAAPRGAWDVEVRFWIDGRTVVGEGQVLKLVALLLRIIGIDNGDGVLFGVIVDADVVARVHHHLVG